MEDPINLDKNKGQKYKKKELNFYFIFYLLDLFFSIFLIKLEYSISPFNIPGK